MYAVPLPPHTSLEFHELCTCVMPSFSLNMPCNVAETLDLYTDLIQIIELL